ncbi:MAG: DUF1501 domain-containing protein [Planctomycetaceae bacterium]|nr:DUF1501 domain-containing protein [Planctomycetaceae bacterium]
MLEWNAMSGKKQQISRRSVLQLGGGVLGGMGLSRLLEAQALSAQAGPLPDTSVIFVWLPGGPPHMETYDLKPDAPEDYRGQFNPIRTKVPGMDIGELLPRHAKIADKFTLIRSCAHKFADHGGGHKRFLTGRAPLEPTGFVNDTPMVGSMAAKVLEEKENPSGLCNYIVLGNGRVNPIDVFSFGSAYLGAETHPFRISADPNAENFKIQNLALASGLFEERLDDRVSLLTGLDKLRKDVDASRVMDSIDSFNELALSMITSREAREAFDLSHESDKLRDRYGRHEWGQRAILARRLVEAGVPWVTVVMENPYVSGIKMPDWGVYNWDSHAVNCHLFKDAEVRFPIYDQVITALIEDIYDRGLDRRVLLVVTGEFGRTPRISVRPGTKSKIDQPGRDHWPRAMSMLVSGGGMRTGQVIGATNSKGEEPVSRPLTPNDLWASVYKHLGINPEHTFPDLGGRPMPILPFGEAIHEIDPVT